MSPFTQLSTIGNGYGNGIDHNFSPILNYVDEFDRHFSHQHRFIKCFIPRFDLEEDAHNYYLYGDVPGTSVDDITVESHDNHTLEIYGKTERPGREKRSQEMETTYVEGPQKTPILTSGRTDVVSEPSNDTEGSNIEGSSNHPVTASEPSQSPNHENHQPHSTFKPISGSQQLQPGHKILFSERLIGDFHRTFAFPQPIIEEKVRATIENGVLSLIVPKKEKQEKIRNARKIPIARGNGRNN